MKWLTLVLLILLTCSMLMGATYIKPGNVYGYWTREGSPYHIQGDITVPHDKYLKIEAGTKVIFEGYYQLNVYGNLRALGEKGRMIVFQSDKNKRGWSGLFFKSDQSIMKTSILSYCKLIYFPNLSESEMPDDVQRTYHDGNDLYDYGAAIEIVGMNNLQITHCVIKRLSPCLTGKAISMINSSPEITCNRISGNRAYEGAGIYIDAESNPLICGNSLEKNISTFGGAICIKNSKPVIVNNLIVANSARMGGGFYISHGSNPILVNNTVVYNTAKLGGAFMYSKASNSVNYNTIIWKNKAGLGTQVYLEDKECDPDFYFCDIERGDTKLHGFEGDGAYYYKGEYVKNLDSDPQFNSCHQYSCSLLPTSPCIDVAISKLPISLPCTDICGNKRISGKKLDMGAYEYQQFIDEDDGEEILSSSVLLHGNYPNPANPNTLISFTVVEPCEVELSIFNIKGQLVKAGESRKYETGLHEVSWNGFDDNGKAVSSGVYYYKLKAGIQQELRKVVLMK